MRVNVHDYSGHLFQSQLSRELAFRGHEVVHGFSAQWVTGHGRLERGDGDPATLSFRSVRAACEVSKYDPVARTRFELSYARAWQRQLDQDHFDVIVACNVPLLTLHRMRGYFARRRQPWVLWHQDVYSMGMAAEATRRLPPRLASVVGRTVTDMEVRQVEEATQVVAIGPAFLGVYASWGVDTSHVQVVPNWAPLEDVRPGLRDNGWAAANGLPSTGLRLLYAGTLGRKHNPLLLLQLLDSVRARGVDATLTVCSEGVGVDDLRAAAAGRRDVLFLGFQPIEVFADVLASADVLLAVLEPDAAAFSIPSKVLAHMSAGRPTVALVPASNPSAQDVATTGGFVSTPDADGATAAGDWLAAVARDVSTLPRLGVAAREFAESRFRIEDVTDRFEGCLDAAAHAVPDRRTRRPAMRPDAVGPREVPGVVRDALPPVGSLSARP